MVKICVISSEGLKDDKEKVQDLPAPEVFNEIPLYTRMKLDSTDDLATIKNPKRRCKGLILALLLGVLLVLCVCLLAVIYLTSDDDQEHVPQHTETHHFEFEITFRGPDPIIQTNTERNNAKFNVDINILNKMEPQETLGNTFTTSAVKKETTQILSRTTRTPQDSNETPPGYASSARLLEFISVPRSTFLPKMSSTSALISGRNSAHNDSPDIMTTENSHITKLLSTREDQSTTDMRTTTNKQKTTYISQTTEEQTTSYISPTSKERAMGYVFSTVNEEKDASTLLEQTSMEPSSVDPLHHIKEEVIVDVDNNTEVFKIPAGDEHESLVFLHDFTYEYTVYLLVDQELCFVKDIGLHLLHPFAFFQMLLNPMYLVHEFIATQEAFIAVPPPLDSVSKFGPYIENLCSDVATFWLEEKNDDDFETVDISELPWMDWGYHDRYNRRRRSAIKPMKKIQFYDADERMHQASILFKKP